MAAVTVLPAVLLAVTVSPLVASIPVGETEQFTATGHYSDGSTQDLTDSVTWASSSSGTATVSNTAGSQGEVTAVADGATTITATDPTTSIEGVSAVTVLPAVLLAVTVSPLVASIPVGETEQFTATGHYSDGSTAGSDRLGHLVIFELGHRHGVEHRRLSGRGHRGRRRCDQHHGHRPDNVHRGRGRRHRASRGAPRGDGLAARRIDTCGRDRAIHRDRPLLRREHRGSDRLGHLGIFELGHRHGVQRRRLSG